MRRIVGPALLSVLFTVNLMAARNTQTFYLSADSRAGNIQLPRGICEVSWDTPTGSKVELTIRSEDKQTFRVPVRMVEGQQDRTGAVTSVVNGVTYLNELHTRNAKFIFENGTEATK